MPTLVEVPVVELEQWLELDLLLLKKLLWEEKFESVKNDLSAALFINLDWKDIQVITKLALDDLRDYMDFDTREKISESLVMPKNKNQRDIVSDKIRWLFFDENEIIDMSLVDDDPEELGFSKFENKPNRWYDSYQDADLD